MQNQTVDPVLRRVRKLTFGDVRVALSNDQVGPFEACFELNVEGSYNISTRPVGNKKSFTPRGHFDIDQIRDFLTLNTLVDAAGTPEL